MGLGIRLVLAPFTAWTQDVYPFYRTTVDTLGGLNPYATAFYTYPPLWADTLFLPFAFLGLLVHPTTWLTLVPSLGEAATASEILTPAVTGPAFNLVLKLPLILVDLGVALLLYRWVSTSLGPTAGKDAVLLWFLNPLVIWVNAVHGQFDVVPAFLTVLACFLLVRRRFAYAGLAVALAALFKVYPLFLLPAFFIFAHSRGAGEEGPRRSLRWIFPLSAFLGGILVVAVILGLPLLGTRFLEAVVIRRGQFPTVGGFNPLFFLALDVWQNISFGRAPLLSLPPLFSPYLLALPILVSLLTGLAVRRRMAESTEGTRNLETVAFLMVLPLVALYSGLVIVNPQHLLWILPFLVLASARWKNLIIPTLVLSLAGLAFFLCLQGPAAFFLPLATYTPLGTPEAIGEGVLRYWSLRGLLSSQLQKDLLFASSGVGYLVLLLATRRVYRHWRANVSGGDSRAAARQPSRLAALPTGPWTRLLALGTAVLVLSQAVILLPYVPAGQAERVLAVTPSQDLLVAEVHGHGLYDASYRITAVGLEGAPDPMPIHVYHDDAYPIANTSRARILGIVDHLRGELALARHPSEVEVINEPALRSVLGGPPAILILATTILPQSVFFPRPTLLRDWIEGGGIVVWAGADMGRYMGLPDGRVVDLTHVLITVEAGPSLILGFDPIPEEGEEEAVWRTPWSRALGIRFPLARLGASVAAVEAVGGLVVGPVTLESSPRTSVSLLPVGAGTVALFGDALSPVFTYSAEDVVAHDIARLLLSGLLSNPAASSAHLLGSERLSLGRGEVGSVRFRLSPPENVTSLRVLVASEVDFDPLLVAEELPIPG